MSPTRPCKFSCPGSLPYFKWRTPIRPASAISVCARLTFLLSFLWPVFPSLRAAGDGTEIQKEPLDRRIEFLYLDANVGLSSGGHNALKLGETIYHFEHHRDGIFRLAREEWPNFHRDRTVLENRSITGASIAVTENTYRMVQEELNTYHVVQDRQIAVLEDVRRDIYLLEVLTGVRQEPLYLPALGLFQGSDASPDPDGKELRRLILEKEGGPALDQLQNRARQTIGSLDPLSSPDLTGVRLEESIYPHFGEFVSEAYREKIMTVAALEILQRGAGLVGSAFYSPEIRARDISCDPGDGVVFDGTRLPGESEKSKEGIEKRDGDPFLLDDGERRVLEKYRDLQLNSILRLLHSERPDRGFPILVAAARYLVLQKSLREGRLVFLDVYPDNHFLVPHDYFCGFKEKVPSMMTDFLNSFRREKEDAFQSPLHEQVYNRLEIIAARYNELARGLAGKEMRIAFDWMLPGRRGPFPAPALNAPLQKQHLALAKSYLREKSYLKELQRIYSYDLVDRNCSTELFRNINHAFPGGVKESRKRLGGYIDPDGTLVFVPYVALQESLSRYRSVEKVRYLSYRKVRLKKMYEEENDAAAYLRESNTLSSTIYEPNDEDSWFLFFTDDAVAPRPLYGLANFAAGFAQTMVGLVRIPFDDGRSVSHGLKGMFFSLPELVFLNIRKGSFQYVPDREIHVVVEREKLESVN